MAVVFRTAIGKKFPIRKFEGINLAEKVRSLILDYNKKNLIKILQTRKISEMQNNDKEEKKDQGDVPLGVPLGDGEASLSHGSSRARQPQPL